MRLKKLFSAIIFLPLFGLSQAKDDSIKLSFHINFGESTAKTDTSLSFGQNRYRLKTCRFYLSNFQLFDENQHLISSFNQAQLLDIEDSNSLQFSIPKEDEARFIRFGVGIDSLTNVSGALGGALDPTNGMYWSWQSGYINVKIEGDYIAPRVRKFEYHLGGHVGANNCYFESQFIPVSDVVEINLALENFIRLAESLSIYKIMSPSAEAAELSRAFSNLFQPAHL